MGRDGRADAREIVAARERRVDRSFRRRFPSSSRRDRRLERRGRGVARTAARHGSRLRVSAGAGVSARCAFSRAMRLAAVGGVMSSRGARRLTGCGVSIVRDETSRQVVRFVVERRAVARLVSRTPRAMACVAAAAAPVWSARRPLPLAGGIGSALARHRRAVAPCPPPNARRGQPFAEWCRENGERGERLLEEFDDDVFSPGELTKGNSERRIRWKCRECGWTWRAGLANRTKDKKPTGCPGCAGKVPTWYNNLELTCKESDGRLEHLIGEWAHPTKRMKDFAPGTTAKVPWKCGGCGHEWDAKIHTRTNATHPSGCPKCAGRHLHDLEVHCAQSDGQLDHLPREWAHPTKSMKDFAPASEVKVPWKCGGCGHEWDATINGRTRAAHSRGCPKCSPGGRPRLQTEAD